MYSLPHQHSHNTFDPERKNMYLHHSYVQKTGGEVVSCTALEGHVVCTASGCRGAFTQGLKLQDVQVLSYAASILRCTNVLPETSTSGHGSTSSTSSLS
jgi:hypothetical protein